MLPGHRCKRCRHGQRLQSTRDDDSMAWSLMNFQYSPQSTKSVIIWWNLGSDRKMKTYVRILQTKGHQY